MSVIILVLLVEEKAAAALLVQIPEEDAVSAFCQIAGEIDGCSGFSYSSFYIIYGDCFQEPKLIHK